MANTTPQPPLPLIVRPGYRLTTLFHFPDFATRDRFEAYRQSCGKAHYFQDEHYGANLTHRQGFWLDSTDLDDFERAFLAGAGATPFEGIRIPWHEQGHSSDLKSPEAEFLGTYFADRGYTIWPSTHALVVIEHAYIRILTTILSAETQAQQTGQQQAD